LNPAQQRRLSIAVEVVPGAGTQDGEDLAQVLTVAFEHVLVRRAVAVRRTVAVRGVRETRESLQHGRHVARFEYLVRVSGMDQAARHSGESRGFGLLRDADAARGLDRLRAGRPVRAGARQDDRDGFLVLLQRERAEEVVDGAAVTAFLERFAELQSAVLEGERAARGDDVDVVGFDGHAIAHFLHRDPRAAAQDVAEHARVVGREVLHDDIRHAAVFGHLIEEFLERGQAAGGRADADDDERQVGPIFEANRGDGVRIPVRALLDLSLFVFGHRRSVNRFAQGVKETSGWVRLSARTGGRV
jgi:hypothetical protein